jgi:serine O-acetyltransferase
MTDAFHHPAGSGDRADQWTLLEAVREDINAVRRFRGGRVIPWLFPNLFAVVGYRLARVLGQKGLTVLAHGLCLVIGALTGIEISWRATIGPGLFVHHPVGVILPADMRAGRNLSIGPGVVVGSMRVDRRGGPSIGDDVSIMAKASVFGEVEVGSRAIIGAHALVIRDVPPGATALGVPAKIYVDGRVVE